MSVPIDQIIQNFQLSLHLCCPAISQLIRLSVIIGFIKTSQMYMYMDFDQITLKLPLKTELREIFRLVLLPRGYNVLNATKRSK